MGSQFYDTLRQVLLQDKRFFSEKGELLRNALYEAALHMDPELLALLLADPITKAKFFSEVNGILVFDKVQFGWLIQNRQFLPDSYTRFKNKIGLIDSKGDYISQSKDIVLVFPYKECLLAGGQTKEDQKRPEVFYNETLAPDQVDRLLHPKVFTRARRYGAEGREEIVELQDHDNLIIKGNNLLALASLRRRYEGRIKLIYIDPPYNTGSDSFGYNDRFKRSTWLTFMKNRIEIAKKMLSTEGVLLVHCSVHHYPYLKVLLDDDQVMGEKNYKMTFHMQVRHPERILAGDKEFNDVMEYILVYSANPEYKMPKKAQEKTNDDYVYEIELLKPGRTHRLDKKTVEIFLPSEYRLHKGEAREDKFKTHSIRGSLREKNSSGRFYVKNLEPLRDQFPPLTLFKVEDMGDDRYGYRYFHLPKAGNKNGTYFQGMPVSRDTTYTPYGNYYDFVTEYNGVHEEGGVEFRNGKKPEKLLHFLIGIFTEKKDWVLDYHLGSGTTCAVAHKMERRYIGVEQLDYGHNDSVVRLQKVIKGEQTGISPVVNWQGGGSFVYCELKALNQIFAERIQEAEHDQDLKAVWEQIKVGGFISPLVSSEALEAGGEDYQALDLAERKKLLLEILDKNMLYVDLCDMEDREFAVTLEEKSFTRSFYRA